MTTSRSIIERDITDTLTEEGHEKELALWSEIMDNGTYSVNGHYELFVVRAIDIEPGDQVLYLDHLKNWNFVVDVQRVTANIIWCSHPIITQGQQTLKVSRHDGATYFVRYPTVKANIARAELAEAE